MSNVVNIESWPKFLDWFDVKMHDGVNYFSGYANPNKFGQNFAVLFYSPSCGWCKKFDPVYIEAASANPEVPHLRVNIAKLQGVMDVFNAQAMVDTPTGEKKMVSLSPLPIDGVPVLASFAAKIEIDRKTGKQQVVSKYFTKFGGDRTKQNVAKYVAGIGKPDTKISFIPRPTKQ